LQGVALCVERAFHHVETRQAGGADAALVTAIQQLTAAGVDIIVDDLFGPRDFPFQDDVVARAAEDDETDRLTAYFGPPSRKRHLWMFVGTTGTIGLILALILLFQTEPPEDVQIVLTRKEEPAEQAIKPTPTPDPVVVTKVEPEPSPQPEPEPEAEPEPPPVEDDFDVEVILLPGPPEKNQGEQFEVTGGAEPVVPNDGFQKIVDDWQPADLVNQNRVDAWAQLQQLVPLEPFGPSDTTSQEKPGGGFSATFVSNQPRRGTQSLLMPYEMTVTNSGPTTIDRLVMNQTLPESVELRETSAVHAADNRTLRWEFEGLQPREQWTVPMVVVPTQQGQVKIPTTLDVGKSTSAKTYIQQPRIELSLTCEPAARYKKYHQIVFLMKNTGEVPLDNLLMDVKLTSNLWHRFGREFEFFHKHLEVGATRRALLHVKTEELGGAQLQASLITDEGAGADGRCEFVVVGNGEIEARGMEAPSSEGVEAESEFHEPQPLPEETPDWRERSSQPEDRTEPMPEAADDSFTRPVDRPVDRSLKDAEGPPVEDQPVRKAPERTPRNQPAESPTNQPAEKPDHKPEQVDDFPDFPGFDEPLPKRKPPSEKPVDEIEAPKESEPVDDPFDPLNSTEEDPFAPKEQEPDFFE